MKILVISDVPWSDDNSVGNTYSNIFKNMKGVEFANLYCKPGIPNSKIVKKYYQITEKKLLMDLIGKKYQESEIQNAQPKKKEHKLYDMARILRFQAFFIIRELIWKIGRWRNKKLDEFIDEYKPDIIFSFCLESIYYIDVIEYCRNFSNAKLALFFADDVYSYIKRNPLYVIYKHYSRIKMKDLVNTSDLIYGATPQLCDEYSVIFKKRIKLLYKICENISNNKLDVNFPLKIIYTGNLFYGRWKTLALIAKSIKEINSNGIKVQLSIYTTGLTTKKMDNVLNLEGASRLLGAIPYEQVKEELRNSDIVLHVESFDKKEIRKTRLSFSTKIVDCMQSGSCLLAVGPVETASVKLLKDYKIAQVVSSNNKETIKSTILKLLDNKSILIDTAYSMYRFALKNHSVNYLENNLYIDMEKLAKEDDV